MKHILHAAMFCMIFTFGCAKTTHYVKSHPQGVDIFLHAQETAHVRFASSRDRFQWHKTLRNEDGYWWVTVPGKGTFTYFFMVNGSLYIPDCALREFDDFGSESCIYQE